MVFTRLFMTLELSPSSGIDLGTSRSKVCDLFSISMFLWYSYCFLIFVAMIDLESLI